MAGNARRNRRRSGGLAAVVLALLLVVCSGIALAADSEPEADEAGLATSAQSDQVELKEERTATSKTFQLPDGSREARIYEAPVNYRDEKGKWRPIDEELKPEGTGLTNAANRFDLRLPERMGSGTVRVTEGDEWVSYRLLGASTDPATVQGDTATYESADGGVAYQLTSLPTGVKEEIEVADASAPAAFSFELDASLGLTPSLAADGSVLFRDASDHLFAMLPAPTISDSAPDTDPSSKPVRYALDPRAEGKWTLRLEVDREWLASPDRVWPATIDPTVTLSPGLHCYFMGLWKAGVPQGSNEDRCSTEFMPVSYTNSGGDTWRFRGLVKFNVSSIPSNWTAPGFDDT